MVGPVHSLARPVFAIAAALGLLIGLYLFFVPAAVATLPAPANANNPWPWPIGPLAVRFIGALALAVAFDSALIALRPDRPTLLAYASSVTIAGVWFLLHILLNAGRIDWSKPIAFAWAGIFVVSLLGGLLAVRALRPGTPRTAPPLPATPQSIAWIPLFIAILTGLVGAGMFFFPEFGRARWPWDLGNNLNVQLFGALFLTVGCAAFWSWRQPSWYGYDVQYPGAGTFSTVALIGALLHWSLFDNHPLAKWLFVAIYAVGGVLGFYPYVRYVLGRETRAMPRRV
jgi:hypothetical protein